LGVNTTADVGFDITAQSGVAFASLTPPGATSSSLYTINLTTGDATLVGTIGGMQLIRDVAVLPLIAVSVSGASFRLPPGLATESIATAFGTGLATTMQRADMIPLPTSLAGTTLKVRDSMGVERLAPLFYVAPGQVNYQIPPGTSTGTAVMAAAVQRIRGTTVTYEQASQIVQGMAVTRPIDLGPETDRVYLLLYGTGIRFRSSLAAVTCQISGTNAEVSYAGALDEFVGLEQINVLLPRSLVGRGEVDVVLTVDGLVANTLRINIAGAQTLR
jgi:hypothetical protein